MKYYYKLIDAVTIPTNIDICWRSNGAIVYGTVRIEPGKTYESVKLKSGREVSLTDDPMLRSSLADATEKVQYTKSYEELLKSYGVKYDIVPPTCHCRKVPSIVFHCVEVYEA